LATHCCSKRSDQPLGLGIFQIVEHFREDHLKLGTTGTSGPLSITPLNVTCGKTVEDIPKPVRDEMDDELERTLDQICFVPTHIRNISDTQMPGYLNMALLVRKQVYPRITASPLIPPPLSPDHAGDTTFIFSIPIGSQPTELRVTSGVTQKKNQTPPELVYDVTT
jgi:hypothetical protein